MGKQERDGGEWLERAGEAPQEQKRDGGEWWRSMGRMVGNKMDGRDPDVSAQG